MRQLSKDIPVPLEPELYIAELQKMEVKVRAEQSNKVWTEQELFTGKKLSDGNLNSTFRTNLITMAQGFAQDMVNKGNIWQPIIITSVARTIEGQAEAMYQLYLKSPPESLWKIYRKDIGASLILAILDELFDAKSKGYDLAEGLFPTPTLQNYLYASPAFSMKRIQEVENKDAIQKILRVIKGQKSQDAVIQKYLVQAINSTSSNVKTEITGILIHMMNNEKRHGKLSLHLDGRSVDVSPTYKFAEDLKIHLDDNTKNSKFKYSDAYSDKHIHIDEK